MNVDREWMDEIRGDKQLLEGDEYVVEGVPIELPVSGKNQKEVHREWQRRIIDDILPDSPNADASEKIPFRILKSLTTARRTTNELEEVVEGDFNPLRPIFRRSMTRGSSIPVAFHVLAVRGTSKTVDSRAFTERTFLLLLRDQHGKLDEELVRRFIERFRLPPDDLDLAQQYLIEHVHPDWDPENEFTVEVQDFIEPVPPFMRDAAELFQRDVRTLLEANLPSADHFQHVNVLLALHLGLYLPRLAWRLNSALEHLESCFEAPESVDSEEIGAIESGTHPSSRFAGRLVIRAPELGSRRRLSLNAPARASYEAMNRELTELHFSLLVFHRLRELTKSYIRARQYIEDDDSLFEMTRFPSQIAERLQWYEEFRRFLARSLEALAVLFVDEQLSGKYRKQGESLLETCSNPLTMLRKCYELYNLQAGNSPRQRRAYKQGPSVSKRLLKHSEYGIVQSRQGVGKYFELGVGLLPLLLLLVVADDEKMPVGDFWDGLAQYGLNFAPKDREILLSRLKSMGLYERFSDAGEANYIRNLLV